MIVGKLDERAARDLRRRLMESPDVSASAKEYLIQHGELKTTVSFQPPSGIHWDDQTYRGDAYSCYAWSCDVAEVEIDSLDYTARVTNVVSVVECGRVIN